MRDNVENMVETGHRWQHNTAHALCMLHREGYRHTFRMCITYCFSTATTVTRTRLSVTFYVGYIACLVKNFSLLVILSTALLHGRYESLNVIHILLP
jgi:hypothetical protein